MKKILYILLMAVVFSACETEIDDFKPSAGEADFSSYVAIGNSLTSGYTDGDLFLSGQLNSYPKMLAGQFATAGGGAFTQPLMTDEAGFGNRLVLDYATNCLGDISLGPVGYSVAPSAENFASIADQGPYNNVGVPGAKTFHLVYPGYGLANPYFGRFASDAQTTTVLADAMMASPTFFTSWIGNNDVLSYAIAGGEADSITDQTTFDQAVGAILQTLTATGAKGAIANIPNITSIPFFTTVPYNPITVDAESAALLNAAYAQYNAGAVAYGLDQISFVEGDNAMIIEDEAYAALGGIRQIKENELVLLTIPQDSIRCAGWGSQVPVPAEYILDEQEIAEIQSATAGFNASLATMAGMYDLAFVDMEARLDELAETGLRYDGVGYAITFVTGGAFSLDGVHMTGQGYAIVANEFIAAINTKYNAQIPTVSVTSYTGIQFP